MRIAIFLVAVAAGCTANETPEVVREAFSQPLPAVDGAHLNVSIVEVRYAPGGSSAPHRHTCPVIGYVIEGALKTQVRGGPSQVYQAGESFYEAPNGVHEISANASRREPVRFLATFVCDHGGPSTLPGAAPAGAIP